MPHNSSAPSKLSKQSGKPAFPARIWRCSNPTLEKPRTNPSGTTAHLEQLPGLRGARQLRSAPETEHRGSGDRKRSLNHWEVTDPRATAVSTQVGLSHGKGSGNWNVVTAGLAHHMESPRSSGQTPRHGTNVPLWPTAVLPTGKPIPESLTGTTPPRGGKDRAVSHLETSHFRALTSRAGDRGHGNSPHRRESSFMTQVCTRY